MKAEYVANTIKLIVAAIGTSLTWMFGGWDIAIQVLVICMALDYITGVLISFAYKKTSSEIGFKGITRKLLIIIILIVAVMLDRLTGTGQWLFRSLVCYFYIANECISLLENASNLGLSIPEKLKAALVQLKDGNEKDISE